MFVQESTRAQNAPKRNRLQELVTLTKRTFNIEQFYDLMQIDFPVYSPGKLHLAPRNALQF